MMERTLTLDVKCGETTCNTSPDEACRFLVTKRFGTETICSLFPSTAIPPDLMCHEVIESSYTVLVEKEGWILR